MRSPETATTSLLSVALSRVPDCRVVAFAVAYSHRRAKTKHPETPLCDVSCAACVLEPEHGFVDALRSSIETYRNALRCSVSTAGPSEPGQPDRPGWQASELCSPGCISTQDLAKWSSESPVPACATPASKLFGSSADAYLKVHHCGASDADDHDYRLNRSRPEFLRSPGAPPEPKRSRHLSRHSFRRDSVLRRENARGRPLQPQCTSVSSHRRATPDLELWSSQLLRRMSE